MGKRWKNTSPTMKIFERWARYPQWCFYSPRAAIPVRISSLISNPCLHLHHFLVEGLLRIPILGRLYLYHIPKQDRLIPVISIAKMRYVLAQIFSNKPFHSWGPQSIPLPLPWTSTYRQRQYQMKYSSFCGEEKWKARGKKFIKTVWRWESSWVTLREDLSV